MKLTEWLRDFFKPKDPCRVTLEDYVLGRRKTFSSGGPIPPETVIKPFTLPDDAFVVMVHCEFVRKVCESGWQYNRRLIFKGFIYRYSREFLEAMRSQDVLRPPITSDLESKLIYKVVHPIAKSLAKSFLEHDLIPLERFREDCQARLKEVLPQPEPTPDRFNFNSKLN